MKPAIAVHKFSSCDGCQLAFLNAGEALLQLLELVEVKHFAEAGYVNPEAKVDIAFVEGSVSTPEELEKIQKIRANSRYLITIGACATAGGIQALRNGKDIKEWMQTVYATPDYIDTLATATAIKDHVKVDFELWGCPINTQQVMAAIRQLLFNVEPLRQEESLCLSCKRKGNVCVLITKEATCMGPVTKTGCGALCPSVGRACYACYGPADTADGEVLANRFAGLGLMPEQIARRFAFITNQAPEYKKTVENLLKTKK